MEEFAHESVLLNSVVRVQKDGLVATVQQRIHVLPVRVRMEEFAQQSVMMTSNVHVNQDGLANAVA
jgi:hypothetical protein